jgi:hypothetical protein
MCFYSLYYIIYINIENYNIKIKDKLLKKIVKLDIYKLVK